MRTVFVVCEGQTEETFISRVVSSAFYPLGIALVGQLIETSVGHKGGALVYDRVQRHLRNTLRRPSQPVVTTLIDLYKLDRSFPGYAEAASKPLDQRLQVLNAAFHKSIVDSVGGRADRFLPYIQPYEFEALLFSDVTELTSIETGWAGATAALQGVRDAVESPEHIDEGPTTKPAAHLERHLTNPRYSKTLHGPRAAERITLAKMESQCRYFAGWLNALRGLASPQAVPETRP
jgi:hypothetical protein